MNWEEKFNRFKNSTTAELYEEKYGSVVGPYLCELGEKDKVHRKQSWLVEQRYNRIQEFYDFDPDGVPVEIQEQFLKNNKLSLDAIIDENLQTHDAEKLRKALEKRFGPQSKFKNEQGYITWIPTGGTEKEKGIQIYERTKEAFEHWKEGTLGSFEVLEIAQFYGYFITRVSWGEIVFEANKPEDVTKYVENICGGFAYHVVPEFFAADIQKNGLRVKNGNTWNLDWDKNGTLYRDTSYRNTTKDQYRYFPKRVYMHATPSTGEKLERELRSVAAMATGTSYEDVAVFKAYVKGLTFYKDPAMVGEDDCAVFTYHSIPPQRLKRIH